jgi:hypothetical protein
VNWPAWWSEKLNEIDVFAPQLHPHNAHARTEHAFQMFMLVAEHFDIGNLLERESGIKGDGTIHVTHRNAD